MTKPSRAFILGAGFSHAAGLPLATELLPLLGERLELDEMRQWLDWLGERLRWLAGGDEQSTSFALNIEQVFHYARFDVEVHRLKQQLISVGRLDGETPWNDAESITAWLSYLEEDLCDVILQKDDEANLAPISRWASALGAGDTVITFNYDTLVERALSALGTQWNHGMGNSEAGTAVCKMHGSLDWIVAHRSENLSKLDLLFEKQNENRSDENTRHREDDFRLWRCRTRDQLKNWIGGRDLQLVGENAGLKSVGIAGLGTYKTLHEIPGLGRVWAKGMKALYDADTAIVAGFAMSDFDAMAQMQFAEVAKAREEKGRLLHVVVIDPFLNEAGKDRFRRVFRSVEFVKRPHENVDWSLY
jgi:hypothetical protein